MFEDFSPTGKKSGARAVKYNERDRIKWFREAKFGLFIHWGLYALLEGYWRKKKAKGLAEWVMQSEKIPVREYEKLAAQFNPVKFNAREWARIARMAGMRYLVITAKHHEGFAMFDSPSNWYNIAQATPFRRDPIKELAQACRKASIRFGVYYSHCLDFHDPDAAGNTFDWPDETRKQFGRYWERKAIPQMRELLTRYGPISVLWLDMPFGMTRQHVLALHRMIRQLQPGCLISGRIGYNLGDYETVGDNDAQANHIDKPWELAGTTAYHTWGYKSYDGIWKSSKTLIRLLVDTVSKGGNYLLNVGPMPTGKFPAPAIQRLATVGAWLRRHGEAIYATEASPYPYDFAWGRITRKPGVLYLHFFRWPGSRPFILRGLRNRVLKASVLGDGQQRIEISQQHDPAHDKHLLTLRLPKRVQEREMPVIKLEIKGKAKADQSILPQDQGLIRLPAFMASIHGPLKIPWPDWPAVKAPGLERGVWARWNTTRNWIDWKFQVIQGGRFTVEVYTAGQKYEKWVGGHKVQLTVAGQTLKAVLSADKKSDNLQGIYYDEAASILGKVILKPGVHRLTLRPLKINKKDPVGFSLVAVRLVPVRSAG
jgi:alpha-L-fucosidase